ncbi:MAG: branched-chain amino acid ABC transporter permease [Nitrososphaerota archaeon]|nr:branched-chain amino acid ABC transporter permease [Candidatus Calditenuis fumarioli]
MIEEALGQIPISLLASSLYAIAATGLTLNYLVLRYADFAIGEYITVGCYVAALLTLSGLDPITSMLAAGLSGAALTLLTDELAIKPLERRGATELQVFIATIGLTLLIRYLLSIAADVRDLLFLSSGFRLIPIVYVGNRPLTNLHLIAIASLSASVAALTYLTLRTKIGKGMRAIASNRDLAVSTGIPVWRIRRFTRVLVGLFAGISGALWAYYTSINPESGWRLLLWVFSASIIGNFTSFPLTLIGGFVIGFSENLGMWALSRGLSVPTAYKPLIPYLAIVVALLYRNRTRLRAVVEA